MPTAVADVPQSPFGARSTAEDVAENLDLTGKTALVTGATAGIGLETVRVLALRGAHVIALGRTKEKAARAAGTLPGKITPLGCEQADFAGVAACADTVKAMGVRLDMLIANAGMVGKSHLELVNGIEKTFAVNHLSHFILVNRLRETVRNGRIVMVSSAAHRYAPREGIAFDNLAGERRYKRFTAYGQSKLANHLFARHLAAQFAAERENRTTANSIHPGVVQTEIFRSLPGIARGFVDTVGRLFMKTREAGAATMCYVATAPALENVSGVYFADCNPMVPGANMENDALAAELWAVSERLTRPYL